MPTQKNRISMALDPAVTSGQEIPIHVAQQPRPSIPADIWRRRNDEQPEEPATDSLSLRSGKTPQFLEGPSPTLAGRTDPQRLALEYLTGTSAREPWEMLAETRSGE
jgi:hypothetical protein